MKKLFKWLGIVVGVVVLAIGLFLVSMRFHDGPLVVFSGGPFETGELSAAPADWSFLTDRAEIEFQTMDPSTSRTVWLGVDDGRLFLVSGYMNTNRGAIWKQWPHYLENDDRIILRIDGKLYEQRLQRVMDGPNVIPVLNEFSRKYGGGGLASADSVINGDTWMYEVVDR
jgi:hypothetical protein